jgi:GTP-binding protein
VVLLRQAVFQLSAARLAQMPQDRGTEIAVCGRSNAGKSSVINALTGIAGLARTSKTPGRTQQINFFQLDPERRLVDLPGYGYAKVPERMKQQWFELVNQYLRTRRSLAGLVLVMDCRHALREMDQRLLQWCEARRIPAHLLLNKADKLSRSAAVQLHRQAKAGLAAFTTPMSIQLFSARTGAGVEEGRGILETWLAAPAHPPQGASSATPMREEDR